MDPNPVGYETFSRIRIRAAPDPTWIWSKTTGQEYKGKIYVMNIRKKSGGIHTDSEPIVKEDQDPEKHFGSTTLTGTQPDCAYSPPLPNYTHSFLLSTFPTFPVANYMPT